jgi:serine/threonine protein phosphatase PrpC
MLVADGLGEDGAGAVASRLSLSTIAHMALHYGQWNLRIDPKTASEIVERAEWFYSRADAAVANKTRTSPSLLGMASALTMAYTAGDDLFIAHVGHSRVYLFRNGKLIQLTRDQTVARKLEAQPSAKTTARAQDLTHILTARPWRRRQRAGGFDRAIPDRRRHHHALHERLTDALSTRNRRGALAPPEPAGDDVTLVEMAKADRRDSAVIIAQCQCRRSDSSISPAYKV